MRAVTAWVMDWFSQRTRVVSSEWVLGIEARVGALLSEGEAAERLYRDSIAHLISFSRQKP